MDVSVSLSVEAHSSLEFVLLSKQVFTSLFGPGADVRKKYVLLTLHGSNVLNTPQLYPVTIKHELKDNQVEIESLKLLQQHGSDFTVETATLRKINTIPRLTSIIVSFPDEVYSLLKHKQRDQIHELLVKERESTLDFAIVRKGDTSHTLNGSFIHAEPFEQGYIDRYTTITIVKENKTIGNSEVEPSSHGAAVEEFDPFDINSTINPIGSKSTIHAAQFDAYFEYSNRAITKGQIIPIALDSSLAESVHQTYSLKGWYPEVIPAGNPDCIAWFMVSNGTYKDITTGEIKPIEPGKQYLVNSNKTRMLQSGVSKRDLSDVDFPTITRYLNIKLKFEYPNILLPGGGKYTFPYAKTLRKIFDTSIKIKGKIVLQTTILLTSNTRFVGKSTLVETVCEDFGFSLVTLDGYDLVNVGLGMPAATVGILKGKLDRLVESCERLVVFIKHIESLCKKGHEQQAEQRSLDDSLSLNIVTLLNEYASKGAIIISSSNDADSINDIVRSKIKFEIDVNVPSEPERREIFKYLVNFPTSSNVPIHEHNDDYLYLASEDVSVDTLALQSAALTPNDLTYIVENVKLNALRRVKKVCKEVELKIQDIIDLNSGAIRLTPADFEVSINKARNKFSDSIGAPRIPNVKWEDVGGLDVVKNEILDTIEMPLKHPELFGSGMKKRSGLLFYGPPGTGKTLLAKAIATNFSLNFFSVKGPELLNMYIGESEANVRRVFEKARDAKPCVIFFDELDSVAPRRGNQGDSGGVMDRIVSQLLAELDGMSGSDGGDGVFVVGASNRPDLLDEALLRPGRFDKMLYLGISDTHDKQAKIIAALTRKFNLHPGIDLQQIAQSCPFNFTGADFYALCSDAMLNAMIRTAREADIKLEQYNQNKEEKDRLNIRQWFEKVATDKDLEVVVSTDDFHEARKELVASVSEQELAHYLRVRENFEGGKK
ncbi:hypothetical protein PMKS-000225 [Pichia membranifaciens]|uniref:Peroxisomal ATPase PEX6 n=1 Tax=Pichia membranifaciens TaxID=4926 RepID=A0A1Q2YB60_9ASCO|nr:hypothetical protein PMKS-000225 [Pichia membranifaciens]